MKKSILFLFALSLIIAVSSCKPDDPPTLGDPPSDADALFTYAATDTSDNIIVFTANNSSLTAKWDLGNGTLGEGASVVGVYPNAGTYTVTLTVFNSGGSASSSQDIVIAEDDPSLLNNQLYTYLTGGAAGSGTKTWVLDSTRKGHMGVGPTTSSTAEWWEADPLTKSAVGMYDDRYVFTLNGFKFDMVTNGDAYANGGHEGEFSSSFLNKDDYTVTHPDQLGETWTITEGEDTTLSVSGSSFLGFYSGVREYKILSLDEDVMYLRYADTKEDLVWYIRLVREDYPVDGGGGGGGGDRNDSTAYNLPIDFESTDNVFTTFGASTGTVIDNPDVSGINTSARVLETVHGDQTWSGIYVDLNSFLDFSGADSMISVKIWAPASGTMRIKIEDQLSSNTFVEKDVMVPTANQWVEVMVGFSGAETGKYDRLVLFPGWDVANAGTFYLDDISQK